MNRKPVCFVIMPFRPELNYFFLYLQRYLSERHNIDVIRGDSSILTRALMDKIQDQIASADLIIGDVTGGNPNVFYELGLAYAHGKPIIFLTQDDPAAAPVDIRQFEFIRYDFDRHEEFLAKIDNAITHVFVERYRQLHERALQLLESFNRDTGAKCKPTNLDEFRNRVVAGEQTEYLPSLEDDVSFANFMLPKIILNPTDLGVMKMITTWLAAKYHDLPEDHGA